MKRSYRHFSANIGASASFKYHFAHCLILAAFFCFSLWDFYYIGVGRPFDYIGIFIVILAVLAAPHSLVFYPRLAPFILVLFGLVIVYASIAVMQGELLSPAAFMIGALFVFPCMAFFKIHKDTVAKFLYFLLLLNIALFLMQLIVYMGKGAVIDFHTLVGSVPSRIYNESLLYFRPAGLYQEPNSYCVNIFMLLVLYLLITKNINVVTVAASLTLLLSKSLWGFGAFAVLAVIFFFYKKNVWFFVVPFIVFSIILYLISVTPITESVTWQRVLSIQEDPSRIARYGDIRDYVSIEYLFGHGLSTAKFQQIGANGVAFLIYCFGFSGSLLLFFLLLYTVGLRYFWVVISVGFLLTTYPIMTYMGFWVWLGLLINFVFQARVKRFFEEKGYKANSNYTLCASVVIQ